MRLLFYKYLYIHGVYIYKLKYSHKTTNDYQSLAIKLQKGDDLDSAAGQEKRWLFYIYE